MLQDLCLSAPTNWGSAVYPPGAVFGPRRMFDYEFVWLIEGDAEYQVDQTVHAAPQGAIVLCRPGGTDGFRWDARRSTRHAFFHFTIDRLPADWPAARDWPVVRLPPEGDVLRPIFRHILTWAGQGDARLRQLGMAHLLLAFVTGEVSTRDAPAPRLPEAVRRALDHLRSVLERDGRRALALAELAEAGCVTPEHLCRLFRQTLNRSPMQTVRLARLDKAAVLLARTNYGVQRIAELCGFVSAFHFSRRFKQAYGLSPTALRVSLAGGQTPPVPRLMVSRTFAT